MQPRNLYVGVTRNSITICELFVSECIFNFRLQQYELYGSEVYMAMSADASCRGLRTSREGPLVLKLSQGEGTPILGSRTDPS